MFFTADMDIDTSGDQPLNAAQLPYIVLPQPTATWDYRNYGIDGGSVVAVVHSNQVGESSYATAVSLGTNPDP